MSTNRWRAATVSFVAVVLAFIGATSAAQQPGFGGRGQRSQEQGLGSGYSRPARSAHGSRSEVIAPYGMVAASQPLAVQVGIDILKAGGNAIDAAVAVNAMLGLVEPHMNGVGGDLFAILWDAKTERLYALNATGRAPYRLNRDVFKARGLDRVPGSGPLSWTVPGAVDGWDQLLTRFGTMNFEQVLAPVIAYARDGFPVSEIISGVWQRSAGRLSEWPDSARTYLPGGRAPRPGDVFKNPNLANTYELIARQGRNAFYKGPIAEKIVAFSEDNGGYFSMRDFEDHTSTWVEPISTGYRGYDVWELPPNSHGITALIMLNIMEGFDLKSMGHNSAEVLHVITEAKKLAFADRGKYVADPEANPLPTAELISKEYGAKRRALLDLEKAASSGHRGRPLRAQRDRLHDGRGQRSECHLADREQLRLLRLEGRPGGAWVRHPEPRVRFFSRSRSPQLAGASQEIAPHQHARLRDQRWQAVPALRRDGWDDAAARARSGTLEHHRLRDEHPRGWRRCACSSFTRHL